MGPGEWAGSRIKPGGPRGQAISTTDAPSVKEHSDAVQAACSASEGALFAVPLRGFV
jgi:hypothetical protein